MRERFPHYLTIQWKIRLEVKFKTKTGSHPACYPRFQVIDFLDSLFRLSCFHTDTDIGFAVILVMGVKISLLVPDHTSGYPRVCQTIINTKPSRGTCAGAFGF
jgi:hypothetical protein